MKKIIFIFLLSPLLASGQTYFGITGYSGLSSFGIKESKPRLSLSGGAFLNIDLGSNISFRQELLYTRDGYSTKKYFQPEVLPSGDTSYYYAGEKKVQYQLHSIETPSVLIYKFGTNVRPYIGLGASFKFIVQSRMKMYRQYREEAFFNIKSETIDIPLIGFVGLETKTKNTPIHFEVRYNHGTFKLLDNRKFSSIYLMIGFKI